MKIGVIWKRSEGWEGVEKWIPGSRQENRRWGLKKSGLGFCTPLVGSFNDPNRESNCVLSFDVCIVTVVEYFPLVNYPN